MCDQLSCTFIKDTLYGNTKLIPEELRNLVKDYVIGTADNIHPGKYILAKLNDLTDRMHVIRWSLIPHDTPDANDMSDHISAAPIETIVTNPNFSTSLQYLRCAILVNGWYQSNQYIRLTTHENFFLAGLWDVWTGQGANQKVTSACIVTCPSYGQLQGKHQRSPIILRPENVENWLNPDKLNSANAINLLAPYSEADFSFQTI